jgi:hypothetical protein
MWYRIITLDFRVLAFRVMVILNFRMLTILNFRMLAFKMLVNLDLRMLVILYFRIPGILDLRILAILDFGILAIPDLKIPGILDFRASVMLDFRICSRQRQERAHPTNSIFTCELLTVTRFRGKLVCWRRNTRWTQQRQTQEPAHSHSANH